MISIHYFASIREALDTDVEELELSAQIKSVSDLIDHLVGVHGEVWAKTLKEKTVLAAINQTVAKLSSSISDGDEIAFFPPVTGG